MSHADALLLGRKTWQIHGGAFEPMKPGRKILTDGSSVLVQTMAENDLADEQSLRVYPVVLGGGKRIFPKGHRVNLKLMESKALPNGVVLMRYTGPSN